MKAQEKLLANLEERVDGVEPPTTEDIRRYAAWIQHNRIMRTFIGWLRWEKTEAFEVLSQKLIDNRNNEDAMQEIANELENSHYDEFLAAEVPLESLDEFLDSWWAFVYDHPELAAKREPTPEEFAAALKAE